MTTPENNPISLKLQGLPLANFTAQAKHATELLRMPQAQLNLSPADAAWVIAHMRLVHFEKGMTLIREGDDTQVDYLLLLLDGDVSVETGLGGSPDAVAMSVVGPGSVIGEMALLDGAPRSVSCIALSPVQAAGLSREGLDRLIELHPHAAAKLLVVLASRIADRLRALGEQLQMYAKLSADQQAELVRLRAPVRR